MIHLARKSLSSCLIIWLLFCMLVVSGCSSYEKRHAGLKAYMDEVKSRPAQEVEPIPQFATFDSHSYSAGNLRDPFRPPQVRKLASGVQPDTNRPKEKLEAFPLDALRMVGTLGRAGDIWALISAPDGSVYRIATGNHIGQNFGKVERVTVNQVSILETVPDGLGGWKKRQVTMTLSEQ